MNPGNLAAGATVGNYVVGRVLGRGGMGVVYEAEEKATGRPVAVKFVLEDAKKEHLDRFHREGRAAAKVSHVNVARVESSGELAGAFYLVFEYLPGGSLDHVVKSRGPIPWREAAALGAQVARGLGAIHAAGLVHRDLKPANVLLDSDGTAKITDFGLVRTVGAGSIALTKTGEMLGTLEYMAPEQADASKKIDGRADLYALGATLFTLVTARAPFQGSGVALIAQHLNQPPPRIRVLVPEVPERFERLILRLLAKAPSDRGTAEDAIAELDAIAGGKREARSLRWLAIPLALVVLALALGLRWAGRRSPEPPPPPPPPPPPAVPRLDRSLLRASGGRQATQGLVVIPLAEGEPKNHRDHVTRAFVTRAKDVVSVGLDGLIILGDHPDPTSSPDRHGKCLVRAGKGPVRALARSPDERLVVTGSDEGELRFWKLDDEKIVPVEKPSWDGHDAILSALFLSEKLVAFGDAKGVVRTLELGKTEPNVLARRHGARVTALAGLHGSPGFLSGGADGAVLEWSGDGPLPRAIQLCDTATEIASLAISKDDRWVLIASERTLDGHDAFDLLLLDRSSGSPPLPPRRVKLERDVVHHGVDFLAGHEEAVTADDDGGIRAWNLETGAQNKKADHDPNLETHSATARSVDASAELLVSTGDDDYVRLVELDKRNGFTGFGSWGAVAQLELSKDQKELLIGRKNGWLEFVDLEHTDRKTPGGRFPFFNTHKDNVAPAYPGRVLLFRDCVLTGHRDGRVRAWGRDDAAHAIQSPAFELDTRRDPVRSFAAIGDAIVVGGERGTLHVFKPDEVELHKYAEGGDDVTDRCVELEGVGTGETLAIVGLSHGLLAAGGRSGAVVQTFKGERKTVVSREPCSALAALGTPDDALLVGHEDGKIELWKPGGGAPLSFLGHEGPILALAPLSGGARFASASGDGTVRVWDLRTKLTTDFVDLVGNDVANTETPTALASRENRLYVGTDAGSVFALELASAGR